jgi:hypothetical protein
MPGYISPRKAASILGVHYNTVLAWCQKAVAGEPSRLTDVQQHMTGYFWISLDEIRALRRMYSQKKNGKQ